MTYAIQVFKNFGQKVSIFWCGCIVPPPCLQVNYHNRWFNIKKLAFLAQVSQIKNNVFVQDVWVQRSTPTGKIIWGKMQ